MKGTSLQLLPFSPGLAFTFLSNVALLILDETEAENQPPTQLIGQCPKAELGYTVPHFRVSKLRLYIRMQFHLQQKSRTDWTFGLQLKQV